MPAFLNPFCATVPQGQRRKAWKRAPQEAAADDLPKQPSDGKLRQQRLVQFQNGEVAVATARRAALLRLLCGGCRGQGEGPLAKVKVPWP